MNKQKKILRIILITFIFALIGWLSLFGEGLQLKYKDFTFWGLAIFLFISILYKKPKEFSSVDLAFFIYLFIVTLGLNFCENKSVALEQYIITFLPIPLLYFSFRGQDRHFILPVTWAIFLFSSCIILVGILELIFRKNIIYELWIENYFYQRYIGSSGRIMSTLIHPTIFGSFLLGCLPFSFFLTSRIKKPYNIFIKIFIVLSIICIIFSFSRGNIVGLIALSLLYLLLTKKTPYIKFIFIGMFILIILSSTILKNEFRFSRFSLSGLSSGWWLDEIEKSSITLKILKEHPLIGIGLNHYRLKFDNYSGQEYKLLEEKIRETGGDPYEWKIPDNMYLSILAETGLLGFVSFLLFLLLLFKKGFTFLKKINDNLRKEFLIVILCGIIGLLFSMNTYDLFYWMNPMLLLWFLIGTLRAIES